MQWGHVTICLKCVCWYVPQSILRPLFLAGKRQYQNPIACWQHVWLQLGLSSCLPHPSGLGWSPSHLIAVNLGLPRTLALVNPQLSWLFGQFVINHNFFVLCFWKWHYLLLFYLRGPKGMCLAACALGACGYQSTLLLLIWSNKSTGTGGSVV